MRQGSESVSSPRPTFLGWTQKKSPLLAPLFGTLPTPWPTHSRPLSRKWRGENELEAPVAMLDFHLSGPGPGRVRLFLGGPQKSPPFFSAQKSQKSLHSWWLAVGTSSFPGFSSSPRKAAGLRQIGVERRPCLNSASASTGRWWDARITPRFEWAAAGPRTFENASKLCGYRPCSAQPTPG